MPSIPKGVIWSPEEEKFIRKINLKIKRIKFPRFNKQ